ncbi:acylase [Salinibacter ruber]|jgi:acyl-homoserine-lactone acylase|uniref:acylase n=1 Tax=Salinibacter ruber TaxID=146919 RepID=UPI000DD75604|nr:acylase [Salinibacter ruber]
MRVLTARRASLAPAIALALLVAAGLSGCGVGQGPDETEILWDTWGVPHVYSSNTDSLMYAFGWAQMRAHGDRVLRLYGEARGRAAEYWGAEHLASDRRVRTLELPEHARRWAGNQDMPFGGYVEAFVAGMNAYAEAHPDRISESRTAVLPVKPRDVFAHTLRTVHATFVAGRDLRQAQRWRRAGSNAWAVGPSRSASGNAMLLTNPHLSWGDRFTWFEAQLTGPDIDAYGAALLGMPFPAVAFNDHLGWTHTVNPIDASDLYRLPLAGDGYRWNGRVRPFNTDTKVLKVKQPDGSLRADTLTVRRSVHGPVVGQRDGAALALRIAGLTQSKLFEQYWRMLRATNLSQFEAALRRQQMPMFNTVYADEDGHILYHFGGRVPERDRGGWSYWQGVVPGDTSATLWNAVHDYEDLPRVVDPPSGWVQNANEPPFTSTLPPRVDSAEVPGYMTPRAPAKSAYMFRPQRSIEMLEGDSSITFAELQAYKNDTRMLAADRLLDDLLPAARASDRERARRAADVLAEWDRTADAASQGSVLFARWLRAMVGGAEAPFATPYRPSAPRTTPDGLADPEAAVQTLAEAAQTVEDRHDSLDVPWGAVHRLVGPEGSYPASGGDGLFGLFRVLRFDEMEGGRRRATFGDSYVALTEFTKEGPRAKAVLPYGNASQPGSPHRGDQLQLYAEKKMRPVWHSRDSVRAHLERRVTF